MFFITCAESHRAVLPRGRAYPGLPYLYLFNGIVTPCPSDSGVLPDGAGVRHDAATGAATAAHRLRLVLPGTGQEARPLALQRHPQTTRRLRRLRAKDSPAEEAGRPQHERVGKDSGATLDLVSEASREGGLT